MLQSSEVDDRSCVFGDHRLKSTIARACSVAVGQSRRTNKIRKSITLKTHILPKTNIKNLTLYFFNKYFRNKNISQKRVFLSFQPWKDSSEAKSLYNREKSSLFGARKVG